MSFQFLYSWKTLSIKWVKWEFRVSYEKKKKNKFGEYLTLSQLFYHFVNIFFALLFLNVLFLRVMCVFLVLLENEYTLTSTFVRIFSYFQDRKKYIIEWNKARFLWGMNIQHGKIKPKKFLIFFLSFVFLFSLRSFFQFYCRLVVSCRLTFPHTYFIFCIMPPDSFFIVRSILWVIVT